MALPADIEITRLHSLEPINRLAPADQTDLLEQSAVVTLAAGDTLYSEGDVDDLASYLLEGSVQILWNGKQVKVIDSRDKAALQALDSSDRKRFTVQANSDITVLRVSRTQLEEKLRRIDVSDKLTSLQISKPSETKWPAWKLKVLRSVMFRPLPMSQIQEIIRLMQRITVTDSQTIVAQGEVGDAYYIIDEGTASVYRHPPRGGVEVHVADLDAGDAFGEEALISQSPRNATVRMSSDGSLLKLPAESFRHLIFEPMVRYFSWDQSDEFLQSGAQWLDVRPPNKFASGSLPGAINLPLTLLRLEHARLEPKQKYLICGDDESKCAVAVLLLAQRGIDAMCLSTTIEQHLAPPSVPEPVMLTGETVDIAPHSVSPESQENEMDDDPTSDPVEAARQKEASLGDLESQEPIARDLYDDTYVGKSLADLIDQMHSRHHELLEDTGSLSLRQNPQQELDLDDFQRGVDETLEDTEVATPSDVNMSDETVHAVTADEGDEISQFMVQLESMLRSTIKQRVARERNELRSQLQNKIDNVKKNAVQEVKRQTQLYREKIRAEHTERTQRLKGQYQKLMELAHRISRQKAELKRARKELEAKLQATTRLQTEIDTLKDTLTQSIGTFDTLDSEFDDSNEINELRLD